MNQAGPDSESGDALVPAQKGYLRRQYDKVGRFINRHSENIAGAISMGGSLIVLSNSFDIDWHNLIQVPMESINYNGDPTNLIASGCFAFTEFTFLLAGHKSWGYSLGAAGLAAGDFVLVFSEATAGEPVLQTTLGIMGGFWLLGALRWPVEAAGKKFSENVRAKFQAVADAIPKITSIGTITTRVPGVAAAWGNNWPLTIAIAAWGTSDFFAGRLQDYVGKLKTGFKKAAHNIRDFFDNHNNNGPGSNPGLMPI